MRKPAHGLGQFRQPVGYLVNAFVLFVDTVHNFAETYAYRDALAKECDEQARLNGMGGEREAALLAKVAVLEAKLAKAGNVVNDLMIGTSPAGSSSLGAARDHAKRWLAGLREETFTRENP